MTNNIVTVDVTQTIAPTPVTLQSTGAMISQGATTLAEGSYELLTKLSDLTSILTGADAVTSLTWLANVVTMTTTAPHGIALGESVSLTIMGATPAAYNGTFVCTSTGTDTLTYPLMSDPGTSPATGTITYTPADVSELVAAATTFFGQGSKQGVYVLELGLGDAADGVVALDAYITANPNSDYVSGATGYFYSYLVPRSWADESTFLTFLGGFESTTARTYFWVTATPSNYTDFTALMKCAVVLVEAPNIPTTEFSLAAAFYAALSYRPSPTNKVTPFAFSYLYGVTPYPTKGNATLLAAFKAASVNYVGTGAEGGISNTILLFGTTKDGRGFTYWYSLDALQINVDVDVSNAIINGSNNAFNPLYYNQQGIDRLQGVAARTVQNMVTYGLAVGQVLQTALDGDAFSEALNSGQFVGKLVVNAVPFLAYASANPGDYKIGEYDGFAIAYVAQNGFIHILFTVNVSDFVAQ